jgi:Ca2+-binding RTX toxin-like protein
MAGVDAPIGPKNVIKGTLEDDVLIITKAKGADGLRGLYEVNFNGRVRLLTEEQLNNIRFELRDGNDLLYVAPDVKANIEANGGEGQDVLIGGGGDDRLSGGAGRDVVIGNGGDDTLWGGLDKDVDVLDAGHDRFDSVMSRDGDKVAPTASPSLSWNNDENDRQIEMWKTSPKL